MVIIYIPLFIGGWVPRGIYKDNVWTNILGVIMCTAGIIFSAWSRITLGKNWSGRVMVQQEHALVKTGPYGIVRHPMYAGFLFALFGTALVLADIFGFSWSVLSAFFMVVKSRQEDKLLAKEFPGDFLKYRQKVKMLLPFVY
ncbi:MAG: isoprenylcysteine carboxylmethyltransferase family protein [Dehalococcoidales bacterium]